MKHVLSSLFMVLCAMSLQAQPVFDWLQTLSATETSKAQTNIQFVAHYADGSALVFGNYGSLSASDAGVLDGQYFSGAEYGTASGYNKNFLLAKLDNAGKLLWAVHSEDGDVNDSQSAVAPTKDGGAVMALKFRHSDHNKQDGVTAPLYRIVDAGGKAFSHDLEYPGAWIKQPVLVRVDKNGNITIVKDMWCSTEQAAKGDGLTTDAFSWAAAVESEDGNIILAGSQSLNMGIDDKTITARPQPEWDGTTTNARYNGFVLKLDKDLKYVAHIISSGDVQTDKPSCVAYRNGKLYFSGLAKAEESAMLALGGKSANVKELSMVNACLTDNLDVEWLAATPIVRYNDRQGNLLYQTLLSQDGKELYVTGGIQGAVELDGQTIHSGGEELSTMNDGYLFAISTEDGSLKKATVMGNKTLNLNHGVVETNDSLYVYNYQYGTISQVAYGRDFQRGVTTVLATGGGSSTIVYASAVKGQVLLALRSKGGQDFKVFGNTVNIAGMWFNTLVAFHLNDEKPEGVETVQTQDAKQGSRKVFRNGQIIIIRDNKEYSILGQEK